MSTDVSEPPASPPPSHGHPPGSTRAALSYRPFRILYTGVSLSMIGTWMQNFTLPAYVDDRTGRPSLVGLMIFMQLGPLLLLSIPAGVLADRVSKQKLQLWMQSIMLVLTLLLAYTVSQNAALWTVFAIQLGIGVANALNAPAFQATMPLLVHRQDLPGAISLNSAMINGSRVLGPVVAALLGTAGLSTSGIFVVNALTYLFLIAALVVVQMPDPRAQHAERGFRRLLTGVNIAKGRPVLIRLLGAMTLFSAVSLAYIGLFPSVVRLNFGIEPSSGTYGWLYGTWGFGCFLGAISVGTWLKDIDRRVIVTRGFIGFAVMLAIFSQLRDTVSPFPAGFLLGFFYFMTATAIVTIFQLNLRATERASVMPLWFMAFGGTVPIGNLAFGPIMEWIGARAVLGIGAAFAVFLAWWVGLDRLPEDAFLAEADGGEPFRPYNASRQI